MSFTCGGAPLLLPYLQLTGETSAILTGQDLEDSSEEEAPTLLEGEQLAEEEEDGQEAEDDGEDHEGLNGLNPFCKREIRQGGVSAAVGGA